MIYFERGSECDDLGIAGLEEGLVTALDKLGIRGRVLAIPPDFTRVHSFAGPLVHLTDKYFGNQLTDILPALGTHAPMSPGEIDEMFRGVPADKFRVHNWREDIVTLGEVPGEFLTEVSGGRVSYGWPAQINRLLTEGGYELILSVGQVVPHEVIGMANYNKNIFVGTGGPEGINKSHFLGAVYGMERIMGRSDTPVRRVLNYASGEFADDLPIIYVQTVVSPDPDRNLKVRGLFIGDDEQCFEKASELSLKVNFEMLSKPLDKVVVYLDPDEFKSTWLGNKSIYRSRMALADEGELIVLGPGVKEFGEDRAIDLLIRKYGYRTSPEILEFVENNDDLRNNLSAAAHLIHGSSENRFRITYCPGRLSQEEIEGVGFGYGDLEAMMQKYDPRQLRDGYNTMPDGEQVFFISNPALGLWAYEGRFED
ncbi:MAG: D-mannonate epimerase [Bacteroides sp. SM23_62]|nr:MAG: D-mannonate epimerase [Bacteroides sp. SM23_62]